ncbi:MAG: hypothetical protein H6Q52_1880, partial [Deltaproteobacteria bacterium]|nr:hypothetical protein [Deltaproteobacteria bacterium]
IKIRVLSRDGREGPEDVEVKKSFSSVALFLGFAYAPYITDG